jgi:DNA-binding response OmpR family regulator
MNKMTEPTQLLIVDDDERICRLLKRYLEHEGFTAETANDGPEMWEVLERCKPDLILLDVMLPSTDGLTLARELRAKNDIGIIMLTGKNSPIDTIVGLEVGADDYVTKPFDNRELLARIRSVLRRTSSRQGSVDNSNDPDGERLLSFNGWEMNLESYELKSPDGEIMNLTNHEFRLLEILVQNNMHIMSRDRILQKLSRRDWMPEDRSVDVTIAKLRKVIEANPSSPKLIRTVRSVGYQFTGKVESS